MRFQQSEALKVCSGDNTVIYRDVDVLNFTRYGHVYPQREHREKPRVRTFQFILDFVFVIGSSSIDTLTIAHTLTIARGPVPTRHASI